MEPDAITLAADLDEIIAGMPHTMVWGAVSLSVSMDDIVMQNDFNGMAGIFAGRDVGVYCKTVASMPAVGDMVTIDSVVFRVTTKRAGPDGVGTQYGLQRKTK